MLECMNMKYTLNLWSYITAKSKSEESEESEESGMRSCADSFPVVPQQHRMENWEYDHLQPAFIAKISKANQLGVGNEMFFRLNALVIQHYVLFISSDCSGFDRAVVCQSRTSGTVSVSALQNLLFVDNIFYGH